MSSKKYMAIGLICGVFAACVSPEAEVRLRGRTPKVEVPGTGLKIPEFTYDFRAGIGQAPTVQHGLPALAGVCFGVQFYDKEGRPLGAPSVSPILPGGQPGILTVPEGASIGLPIAFEWEGQSSDLAVAGGKQVILPQALAGQDFYSWGHPVAVDFSMGSLVLYHAMTLEAGNYNQANTRAHTMRQAIEDSFVATGTIVMPPIPSYVHEICFLMLEREADGDVRIIVAAPGAAFTMFDLEFNGVPGYATLGTSSVLTNQDGEWVLAETILDAGDINLSSTTEFENTFRVSYQTDTLPRVFEENHTLTVTP